MAPDVAEQPKDQSKAGTGRVTVPWARLGCGSSTTGRKFLSPLGGWGGPLIIYSSRLVPSASTTVLDVKYALFEIEDQGAGVSTPWASALCGTKAPKQDITINPINRVSESTLLSLRLNFFSISIPRKQIETVYTLKIRWHFLTIDPKAGIECFFPRNHNQNCTLFLKAFSVPTWSGLYLI